MPKPSALALQLKSKTLNFKFRIPHNLLPTARFSLILKFRQCRLKLKSVPPTRCWLKSKLFRFTTIPFTKPKPKSQLLMLACRSRYKLLSVLFITILSFWALLNFSDSLMSCLWWFATSFIDLKDVISKIIAAMGRIEDPALRFF